MTIIKICGITDATEAISTARAGADILGLVFASGRHRVGAQQAGQIVRQVRQLPRRIALAGIFVNEDSSFINHIATQCDLDIVQLSGDEDTEYCRQIDFPIIKAVHVGPASNLQQILGKIVDFYRLMQERPVICMLDSKVGSSYGGSGSIFDWHIAAEAALRFPVIIAGGLRPDNVRRLIRNVSPIGVDVSTGVETDGHKDIHKVTDFIRAVRLAHNRTPYDSRTLLTKLLQRGDQHAS